MPRAKKSAASKAESGAKHQWVQISKIAQKDKSGTFYPYRCENCDAYYKRRGEKWNPKVGDCTKKPKTTKLAKPTKFKASEEEAKKRTVEVKAKFAVMGKLWWELGAEVKACIDDYVPQALGRNASEWMKECFGDSWLRVYRAHRAIAALPGVDKAKLEKISEGNAYQLARLPENIRKSEEWIDKAGKLENEVFKAAVEKQREKRGIKKDPMVKLFDIFKINSVPQTLADTMKEAIKLAAQAAQVDLETKEGRIHAVEMIFADFLTSQPSDADIEEAGTKTKGAGA